MLADYEKTGNLPPLPGVRARPPARQPRADDARGAHPPPPRHGGARAVRRPGRRGHQPAGPVRRVRRAARRHRAGHRRVLRQAPVRGRSSEERFVHVHLGLYGKFDLHDGPPPPPGRAGPAAHRSPARAPPVVRRPARCHRLRAAHRRAAARRSLDRLGPDPLRDDADWTRAWERVRRSRAPIGGLLMDQAVLAGVGNVYRAEVLFRHRMHPLRPGQHPAPRPVRGDVGRPRRASCRGGPDRPDRHRARRAHARGDGPRPRASTTTGERSTSTGAHGQPCLRLRRQGPHRGARRRATCSGARAASRAFRSRAGAR